MQALNLAYPGIVKWERRSEANELHGRLLRSGECWKAEVILSLSSSTHTPHVHLARTLFFSHHAFRTHPFSSSDPFLWNAILKSYSHDPLGALHVFSLMLHSHTPIDPFSLSLLLKACSSPPFLPLGMQLHAFFLKLPLSHHLFLLNCFLSFYTRCSSLSLASHLFHNMPSRDTVSYNTMIAAYVKLGRIHSARDLFDSMPPQCKDATTWNSLIGGYVKLQNGLSSALKLFDQMPHRDVISWNLIIEGCCKSRRMDDAQILFDLMPAKDAVSWANIIDGYAKIGRVSHARKLFGQMPHKDTVAFNVMIGGYLYNGCNAEALDLFYEMQAPDEISLSMALSSVAGIGRLEHGGAIHCYIVKNTFSTRGKLGVALIDMYSKCGCIEKASELFHRLPSPSVDHFNAMIGGYAVHGMGGMAFELFLDMHRRHVAPDDITFIGMLHACGHAGMVKEGIMCFGLMRRRKSKPKVQHYGCMVDMLCRAGKLSMATQLVEGMPMKPNDVILKTLLAAAKNESEMRKLVKRFEAVSCGVCVTLSNKSASWGMWSEARKARDLIKETNMKKLPGCSWLELDGEVHSFVSHDRLHPRANDLYSLLN